MVKNKQVTLFVDVSFVRSVGCFVLYENFDKSITFLARIPIVEWRQKEIDEQQNETHGWNGIFTVLWMRRRCLLPICWNPTTKITFWPFSGHLVPSTRHTWIECVRKSKKNLIWIFLIDVPMHFLSQHNVSNRCFHFILFYRVFVCLRSWLQTHSHTHSWLLFDIALVRW